MESKDSKSTLQCPITGCKSAPFASAQNLARHKTAKHGAPVTMLCGKELQDVRYNYQRHMFGSCGLCIDILRMLGGRELRADLKDTSLDTLRRRHQAMLQQNCIPGAEQLRVTPNGVEPKGEHGECKTPSNTTTWNNQALDDNSISEMFTDQPCACLEFSPTPKSADITGPDHRNFAESSHSRFDYATEGNVETNSQQEFSISGHFEDAIGPNQRYQIDFDSMEMSWWEEMSSEAQWFD